MQNQDGYDTLVELVGEENIRHPNMNATRSLIIERFVTGGMRSEIFNTLYQGMNVSGLADWIKAAGTETMAKAFRNAENKAASPGDVLRHIQWDDSVPDDIRSAFIPVVNGFEPWQVSV
jgi:cytochrome c1